MLVLVALQILALVFLGWLLLSLSCLALFFLPQGGGGYRHNDLFRLTDVT